MGLFESLLSRYERERHSGILGDLARRRREPAEDPYDGFLPPARAAELMAVGEVELADLVRGGMLEARSFGGKVYVRPAVLSRLAVVDRP